MRLVISPLFFFNDTATTEIYTLSLHDALPILLILGLWTPIAGTLVILVEVCFVSLGTTQLRSTILLGALGAALAVLGPGIRSIDALRYGRKRFDIRDP